MLDMLYSVLFNSHKSSCHCLMFDMETVDLKLLFSTQSLAENGKRQACKPFHENCL